MVAMGWVGLGWVLFPDWFVVCLVLLFLLGGLDSVGSVGSTIFGWFFRMNFGDYFLFNFRVFF